MRLHISPRCCDLPLQFRRLSLSVAFAAALAMCVMTVSGRTSDRSGEAPSATVVATDRHTETTTTAPVVVNGGTVVRAPAWGGQGWPGRSWHGGGWSGR
jgi:hypothetical protein